MRRRFWYVPGFALAVVLTAASTLRAQLPPEVPVRLEAPDIRAPILDQLPRYQLDVDMPALSGMIHVKQHVEWTNLGTEPTGEILLHAYARHRPTKEQLAVYERTMESFRITPRIAIDKEGRRFHLRRLCSGDQDLEYYWDENADTVLHVRLPQPVNPGETVDFDLEFDLDVQEFHYRLGMWKGVTNLLNWYPIVAYYGPKGWNAPPFVGWHQPWLNEAGHYEVSLRLPRHLQPVTSGYLVESADDEEGKRVHRFSGTGIRDFSIVVSTRHEVHEAEAEGVRITVHAFPEHRFYARLALQTAVECIERYTKLIGPYPHPEFKVVESYFGWNGNETSGMVLIDERVFDAPQLGHIYVDHLVSHEVLHQWWYATVGTDGYNETWMDEALVSHLTENRIHEKYGDSIKMLDLPKMLRWMPNIDYDDFMHSGYPLYRARGGDGNVLAPLSEMGHVHNLFFLAYDRGGKVVGMIHARLGTDRFYEFLRLVYAKYQFRVLFVDDFQRELEEFTGESWQAFFDDWLRSPKSTDWKVKNVRIHEAANGYETTVLVRQLGEIEEPVQIALLNEKRGPVEQEVRLLPGAGNYQAGSTRVESIGNNEWRVTFVSNERPAQVEIDPHSEILDVNPVNNRWKVDPKIRLTPFYTPLDEVAMVRPLDRPSFSAGPGVDLEGRAAIRGSWMLPNRYRISPYIAYPITPNDSVLVAGVDGELMNFPAPNLALGGKYERTLATDLFYLPDNQGEVYLRWNQIYTTSLFMPNIMYTDIYFRFGDNFFPDENFRPPDNPAAEYYRDIRAAGIRYHLDTRMPYWNPEKGFSIDAAVENGFHFAGAGESFIRGFGQVAGVHKLPEGLGYFSETRIATRLRGGVGSPDNGEHFHFGGPTSFRGQRSEDTEGAAFWLTGADWRFPLWEEIDQGFVDQVLNWRTLYGAILYDVGESYILGHSQGLDHALGVGLYFDMSLFSFVERITLRTEYAQSLRYGSNILWFGAYYAY